MFVSLFIVGTISNGICGTGAEKAKVKKKTDSFNTFFKGKPTKKDMECFNSCKKKGYDCGYNQAEKRKEDLVTRETLQIGEITEDCMCLKGRYKKVPVK